MNKIFNASYIPLEGAERVADVKFDYLFPNPPLDYREADGTYIVKYITELLNMGHRTLMIDVEGAHTREDLRDLLRETPDQWEGARNFYRTYAWYVATAVWNWTHSKNLPYDYIEWGFYGFPTRFLISDEYSYDDILDTAQRELDDLPWTTCLYPSLYVYSDTPEEHQERLRLTSELIWDLDTDKPIYPVLTSRIGRGDERRHMNAKEFYSYVKRAKETVPADSFVFWDGTSAWEDRRVTESQIADALNG